MTDYMLIYKGGDPNWRENASQEDFAATMERWGAWMGNLGQKGQLVSGGSPLEYTGKNLTKDGVATDLSAAELKELVTGFSIIKAKDIDEAIAIAKECPIFDYPSITVQVRPVADMS